MCFALRVWGGAWRGGRFSNNKDHGVNLYGEAVEVDYRGYEVTVQSFLRILTGNCPPPPPPPHPAPPGAPRQLPSRTFIRRHPRTSHQRTSCAGDTNACPQPETCWAAMRSCLSARVSTSLTALNQIPWHHAAPIVAFHGMALLKVRIRGSSIAIALYLLLLRMRIRLVTTQLAAVELEELVMIVHNVSDAMQLGIPCGVASELVATCGEASGRASDSVLFCEVLGWRFKRVRWGAGRTAREAVPRSKRLLSDSGSNVLVYLTGHGGDDFLKFQDQEEMMGAVRPDPPHALLSPCAPHATSAPPPPPPPPTHARGLQVHLLLQRFLRGPRSTFVFWGRFFSTRGAQCHGHLSLFHGLHRVSTLLCSLYSSLRCTQFRASTAIFQ